RTARDHSGRGARSLRSAARLPVQPALRLCDATDRQGASGPAPLEGRPDPLSLSPRRSRTGRAHRIRPGRRRRGATRRARDRVMTALVTATDLKRSYEVRQGWFRARAHLQAIGGISFALDAGKTLAVVGESGCGKSTLARLVTLIEKPSAGTLVLDGVDAVNPPASAVKTLRRSVQIVFQNPYGSLNPRKRVGAILEEPLIINTKLSKQERREQAIDMMARVGLRPEQYGRYPHMFSGGQRQRIAIARALMLRPKLLVADEPVSALDMSVQAQVLNL